MSTSSESSNVFVAPGVLANFAGHLGLDADSEETLLALKTQVAELVHLYARQGMKSFWEPADLSVAHVVIGNHLLNGVDSNQLIMDVENFEVVFSGVQELFTVFVTEKRRSVFNETVAMYKGLPATQKAALEGALHLAISTLDESADSKQLVSQDDRKLYEIAQQVKNQQPQPGWARLRLELVLGMLNGTVELADSAPGPVVESAPAAVVPVAVAPAAVAPAAVAPAAVTVPVSVPVPDTAVAIRAAAM